MEDAWSRVRGPRRAGTERQGRKGTWTNLPDAALVALATELVDYSSGETQMRMEWQQIEEEGG